MGKSYDKRTTTTSSDIAGVDTATQASSATCSAGNQDQASDAGLAGGANASDMGLDGSMADVILDCMPLESAVLTARDHADNPAVREWAAAQDVASLAARIELIGSTVADSVWPVGQGIVGKFDIGAAVGVGAELLVEAGVLRTAQDAARLALEYDFAVRAGGGVGASAGGGAAGADLGAEAGVATFLRFEGGPTATVEFDFADALTGELQQLQEPEKVVLGEQVQQAELPELQDVLTDEMLEGPFEDDPRVSMGVSAEAEALATDTFQCWGPLAPLGKPLELLGASMDLVARLAAGAKVELWTEGQSASVLSVVLGGDAEFGVLDELGALGLLTGEETEKVLTTTAQGVEWAFDLVWAADGDLAPAGRVRATRTAAQGTAETQTTITGGSASEVWELLNVSGASIDDKVASVAAADPELAERERSLSEIVAAYDSGTSFGTSIKVDVTTEQLDAVSPGLLRRLVPDDLALAEADVEIYLEASAAVEMGAIQAAADLGLKAPGVAEWGMVVSEVADALLAAKFGQALPGWLEPQRAILQAAAEGVGDLVAPRLKGRISLASGVEVSGMAALDVGAHSGVDVMVDQAASLEEVEQLRRAVA